MPNSEQLRSSTSEALSRRRILALGTLAAGGVVASAVVPDWVRAAPSGSAWSDPGTWGGQVPGPGSTATISTGTVVLDTDATVGGLVILPGSTLVFDPARSVTLTCTANLVDQGTLSMRPNSAAVVHRIVFPGINEGQFVGGGMTPLATDVGLWVTGAGLLDCSGSPKLAWTRAAGAVAAGATSIALAVAPVGWLPGDEIVLTPTQPPTVNGHHDAYDVSTIAAIAGATVTLTTPTRVAHPAVSLGDGRTFTCEVLNLTRNVRIEGTPSGRAHVFVISTRPQIVASTSIRHVAPNGPVGRYGLHFHMCGAGSRGSLVDGVVVRDAAHHAFVPHLSDGITFRNCISHDTYEDAYWWDTATSPATVPQAPPTNDLRYESCVASRVRSTVDFRGFRLTGFMLGAGTGSVATGCVAVGVQGNVDASGFTWPEMSQGVWTFDTCVAHNNAVDGIFTWQNNRNAHVIDSFVAYYNGGYGIDHGAYRNAYRYQRCVLYGNLKGGIGLRAVNAGFEGRPLRVTNVLIDGSGFSPAGIECRDHTLGPDGPMLVDHCTFRGHTIAGIHLPGRAGQPDLIDVVDCVFSGNELMLATTVDAGSQLRVQDAVRGALLVVPVGGGGTRSVAWNADVTPIAPFTTSTAVQGAFDTGSGGSLTGPNAPSGGDGAQANPTPTSPTATGQRVVTLAASPDGRGYRIAVSDGGVYGFGGAAVPGSAKSLILAQPIVGMAATPTGQGYWLVAADGGVFSYGDARFFGSTGNLRLNRPVVGMASSPSGNGYWFVATDGGIFSYGDARFFGSTGGVSLNQPIVGMAATPTGRGYWLVAADGGIFSYGDAAFLGSLTA